MRTLGRRIDFAAGEMYSVNKVSARLVYFVCFASQNAILSQPSADSSFPKEPGPTGDGGFYGYNLGRIIQALDCQLTDILTVVEE